MGHCSSLIKSIFPVLRIKFEVDIPKSVDVNASHVIILNHQHRLDAYLLNQVVPKHQDIQLDGVNILKSF